MHARGRTGNRDHYSAGFSRLCSVNGGGAGLAALCVDAFRAARAGRHRPRRAGLHRRLGKEAATQRCLMAAPLRARAGGGGFRNSAFGLKQTKTIGCADPLRALSAPSARLQIAAPGPVPDDAVRSLRFRAAKV